MDWKDPGTIIQSSEEDWSRKATTPIADLRAFIEYAKQYSAPLHLLSINLDNHPVHLLSPRFIVDLKGALEAHGYNVTIESHPEGGWIVDWEKSDV